MSRGQSTVDTTLWETYDRGGWIQLTANEYTTAAQYFEEANARADAAQFPEKDYRRGRTLLGLAWGKYHTAQSDESATTDPDALFRQIHSDADRAVTLLNSPELPGRERVYLAYAYHLLALTQIELCQGANARQTLTWAADLYTETGHEALACEVRHYLGKLLQCQRSFAAATRLYRQVASGTEDREREARALLDTVNLLGWSGRLGTARNERRRWEVLKTLLAESDPSPTRLFLRADLVFARVAVECGEFPDAEQLLCDARRLLCTVGAGPGDLCLIVYQILWARLALAKGDLGRADRCLQEIDLECDLFQHGYDCLEILAPDAACRQCVIQSCMHEFVCRRRCRRIRPCRVCFAVEEESMELVDVKAILKQLVRQLRARIWFGLGAFHPTEDSLHQIEQQLSALIASDTSARLGPSIELGESMQAQTTHAEKAADQFDEAFRLIESFAWPAHLEVCRIKRLLGDWREFLGEYDLARRLYMEALRHSRFNKFRPDHAFLAVRLGFVELALEASSREENPPVKIDGEFARKRMARGVAVLQDAVHCFDFRLLTSHGMVAWSYVLDGCISYAQNRFLRLNELWAERSALWAALDPRRQGGNTLESVDPRQSSALLGFLVTILECGVPPPEADETYRRYRAVADRRFRDNCRDLGLAMVAYELYRFGLLMKAVNLLASAEYLFTKSLDLYTEIGLPDYVRTIRGHLESVRQARGR